MPHEPDTTLEGRVERLEKWARKPSWLDEPAEINGEPVVMGSSFPVEIKILGCALAAALIVCATMTAVAMVHYYITGQPL